MLKEAKNIISRADGLILDLLVTAPEGKPKGVVQICHGMSENKERYLPFMEFLSQNGYAAVIHDHRGHGRSIRESSELGHMYDQCGDALAADTAQVTAFTRKRFPGAGLVLMGHSMGSLIVRVCVKKNDCIADAVILCGSPSKRFGLTAGRAAAYCMKKIRGSRYKSPALEFLALGGNAGRFVNEHPRYGWISSDFAVVEEYENSPLCGFVFSVNGYQALFDLMQETYSSLGWDCQNPYLPILFIGGADDPCIKNVRKFKEAINHMRYMGYRNIRGKLYPGMRHEILNEREKERVFSDICKYINKQLGDR